MDEEGKEEDEEREGVLDQVEEVRKKWDEQRSGSRGMRRRRQRRTRRRGAGDGVQYGQKQGAEGWPICGGCACWGWC